MGRGAETDDGPERHARRTAPIRPPPQPSQVCGSCQHARTHASKCVYARACVCLVYHTHRIVIEPRLRRQIQRGAVRCKLRGVGNQCMSQSYVTVKRTWFPFLTPWQLRGVYRAASPLLHALLRAMPLTIFTSPSCVHMCTRAMEGVLTHGTCR